MIEVKDLTKKYGDHTAVDRLSFRVEEGEVIGFLGPNGAGKSTTMNILTGYLAPTAGTVTVDGIDIQKDPEGVRSRIGYLPEIPPVYTDMTVWEYLLFAAELKKLPKAERKARVESVMEMTGITEMKNRLIRNLSKGYRQRVGLAQAILGDPRLLILDEPTVGLDPKQIIEIRDLIRSLGKQHTVILSSHILSEVSAVCDRIMILSEGRLVACDTPEGLQQMLTPGTELEIRLFSEADARKAKQILEVLPGVSSVTLREGTEPGLSVTSGEGEEIRQAVAVALADNKIPVAEMKAEQNSLEEIFLRLTGESGPSEKEEKPEKRGFFRRKKKEKGLKEPREEKAPEQTEENAAEQRKDEAFDDGKEEDHDSDL
ncbi:MAG: ABC transporter ATP-binding protein [Lachnospiraceae bacterium]|nr:ABC transporter ATP-binding protein [Lachnospiraceae bacterium]